MTPEDIRRAADYDLFVERSGRFYQLVATIVEWVDNQNPMWVSDRVLVALDELKEMVE